MRPIDRDRARRAYGGGIPRSYEVLVPQGRRGALPIMHMLICAYGEPERVQGHLLGLPTRQPNTANKSYYWHIFDADWRCCMAPPFKNTMQAVRWLDQQAGARGIPMSKIPVEWLDRFAAIHKEEPNAPIHQPLPTPDPGATGGPDDPG